MASVETGAFRRDPPTRVVTRGLAEAWSATHPCMAQAATRCDPHGLSPRHQQPPVRFRHTRISLEPSLTHDPGVPQHLSRRGDEAGGGLVRRARRAVDAHPQQRLVRALTEEQETASRARVASALSWRTLAMVQG
jgi:hypothetical protein